MRRWRPTRLSSTLMKLGALLLILIVTLSSCIKPITSGDIMHVTDDVEPSIIVLSPADAGFYAATVVVRGVVQDLATTLGHAGEVISLSYEVLSSTLGGDIPIEEFGYFTFQFPTDVLTGTIVVKITAADWNGNIAEKLFSLVDGSAIPSFGVDPGDGSVTLTWDPVPVSESYTIYYEKSNIQPTEAYSPSLPDVDPGYTMTGMENGEIYLFMLQSHSSSGSDNWSNVIKAIPLAPEQLTPTLVPEASSILVRWTPVPGADEYVLWKSATPESGYINITGVTDETEMRDSAVQPGQRYYYAVQPASYNETRSIPASAELPAFAPYHMRDTVGSIDNGGYYWWVDLYENASNELFAYAAEAQYDRILIYDVTNPEAPEQIGSVPTSQNPSGIVVEGSYLYVAAGSAGLRVYSIDDSTGLLTSAGTFTDESPSDVAVVGTTAYITTTSFGVGTLHILDCSSLPTIAESGACTFSTSVSAVRVAVKDDHAYVAGDGGVRYIDCGDLENPVENGGYASGSVTNVTVDGDFLYVAESAGIRVFDVTTASNPIARGSLATDDYVYEIAVDSSTPQVGPHLIYAAAKNAGLRIINVLDPTAPLESGFCTPPSWAFGAAVRMPYAYVAGYTAGLQIFNVNAPISPTEVSFWKPGGTHARAVAVVDQYGYVADDVNGFGIIDISIPSSPDEMALVSTSGSPVDIAVCWPYAYVLNNAEGFEIFDVSNPRQPQSLGTVTSPGYALRLFASGSYVYLADRSDGLQIYDLRDKTAPVIAGNYLTSDEVEDVAVYGEHAYVVTDGAGWLYVLEVSNPAFPVKVGELDLPTACTTVTVSGNTVYVNGGAYVIDVTIPSSPNLLGTSTGGTHAGVSGSYVFQALGSSGVGVLNVSDPGNPVRDAIVGTDGQVTEVVVQGGYMYVADWTEGLRIFDLNSYD